MAESIDMSIAFRQSRYDRSSGTGEDEGDYINCPLNQEEYEAFVAAILAAPKLELKGADKELERYFEGCMPIEALAARGVKSLAFGPMRPVGLRDPARGGGPMLLFSCGRTTSQARSTTWSASRPTCAGAPRPRRCR